MRIGKYLGLALLLVGVLFVVAQCSWAQDAAKPAAKPAVEAAGKVAGATGAAAHRGANLKDLLNLTPDQEAKIKTIREKEMADMKALRDDKALSKEVQREKSKAIREETKKAIRATLTPEQQAKFDKIPQRPAGRPKGEGPKGKDK